MKVWSESFEEGALLDGRLAFCVPATDGHVALSDNRNPQLAWEGLPSGTRSLAIICHDPDVPSVGDDVNQEGREVPDSLARVDFYHWILVDLDPSSGPIGEGEFASGVTAKGKSGPAGPRDTRQGINDYTGWFGADPEMGGQYFGYDGPCPPWNDSIIHHYHFTVYALDIARAPLGSGSADLMGAAVVAALRPHILDEASIMGRYTLNPRLR